MDQKNTIAAALVSACFFDNKNAECSQALGYF
jgi:hypothetical protein